LAAVVEQNSEAKPVCNIPLCGKEGEWRVEMFGRVEYYCERHRPGVPEKFMEKITPH
jgi:hypothetical protein